MSEYRGEQAEMNIQRLNVRIDQVMTMRITGDNIDNTGCGLRYLKWLYMASKDSVG